MLQKRLQRARGKSPQKSTPTDDKEQSSTPKTPRSKTNSVIRKAGVSPKNLPRPIRKQLLFAQVVVDEVEASLKTSNASFKKSTRRGLAASIVSGNILRKYRCVRTLSKAISLNRTTLSKSQGKLMYPAKQREVQKQKQLNKAIQEFLERDDNSRMMPGKGDFRNCDGVKVQKRYLNDYMHNLHAKFRAENPEINISRSVFCRRRPLHILPTSFTSRNTCLCQRHQNMSLKLRTI